jgi:2-oxoglutarate ferredoxin oxidoreductase subunit delta
MVQYETLAAPRAVLQIRPQWCKGCNLCVETCKHQVLALNELGKISVVQLENCQGCGLCEATCPDYAIKVMKNA